MKDIQAGREFMKSNFGQGLERPSDQQRGMPYPPLQKEVEEGDILALPEVDPEVISNSDFFTVLEERQSRRTYSDRPLNLAEVAFLLYCTQGVKQEISQGYATKRTVPSAGARHPYETYLAVNHVENLEPGLYRYLPLSHRLLSLGPVAGLPQRLNEANFGQRFVGDAACVFIWSCVPYRAEWRYGAHAHKNMLLDAGHICQNLYLAVEAIGAGTCAIGAYDQNMMDELLGLDGKEEYVVYLAPVGKP
ncbi:MAG: SagB/ThcOx family dehydrogenase [Anaerolineales bacterium]